MTIKLKKKEDEIYIMRECLHLLVRHADEIPEVEWIWYKYGLPYMVYELIKNDIHFREIQVRIQAFSEKSWIEPKIIRKWLKSYTMTEIENSYKDGKIILKDLKYYDKNTEE